MLDRAMKDPSASFFYKPRTGSGCALWIPLFVPLFTLIAVIQERDKIAELWIGAVIFGVALAIGGGLSLSLKLISWLSQRNNAIWVTRDGVLMGCFGLLKVQTKVPLTSISWLELRRKRSRPRSGPRHVTGARRSCR